MAPDHVNIKTNIISIYNEIRQRRGHFYGICAHISRLLIRQNIVVDRSFVRRTIQTYNSCGKIYRIRTGRRQTISNNPVRTFYAK